MKGPCNGPTDTIRPMVESPRPDDLGEQRTPLDPEPPDDERSTADPRSEPGSAGAAARYPYAIIAIAFVLFALIALYLAWNVVPPR